MAAAVVPTQHALRHTLGGTFTQDALDITEVRLMLLGGVIFDEMATFEEFSWWKLALVSYHYHLISASDGTEGIDRLYLACLVDQEQIEA